MGQGAQEFQEEHVRTALQNRTGVKPRRTHAAIGDRKTRRTRNCGSVIDGCKRKATGQNRPARPARRPSRLGQVIGVLCESLGERLASIGNLANQSLRHSWRRPMPFLCILDLTFWHVTRKKRRVFCQLQFVRAKPGIRPVVRFRYHQPRLTPFPPASTHWIVSRRSSQDGDIHMRRVRTFLRRLLKLEDGPTAVEYAVMLALIVVICVAAIHQVGRQSRRDFRHTSQALQAGS
jgi:pilus assembly protein Flp/PilA